jgi:hypothetical protein
LVSSAGASRTFFRRGVAGADAIALPPGAMPAPVAALVVAPPPAGLLGGGGCCTAAAPDGFGGALTS